MDKQSFFNPKSKYYGGNNPAFNANLQDFVNHVSTICALETNGKLEQEDAYRKIKALWKALKKSHKALKQDDIPQ
jgi:organic radical activating enzyme